MYNKLYFSEKVTESVIWMTAAAIANNLKVHFCKKNKFFLINFLYVVHDDKLEILFCSLKLAIFTFYTYVHANANKGVEI